MTGLIVTTERKDARAAYGSLRQAILAAKPARINAPLGHRGVLVPDVPLLWIEQEGMWINTWLNQTVGMTLGIGRPHQSRSNDMAVHINCPIGEENWRYGGILLKDANGSHYFAHTGKIGGGKKSVGKTNFLAHSNVRLTEVRTSKGRQQVIVIGRADARDLLRRIATFARKVEQFKADVSDRGLNEQAGSGSAGGQGYGLTTAEKKAVESYAMKVALRRLEQCFPERDGWQIEDTHKMLPYDYKVKCGNRSVIVEVKGTTGTGQNIEITEGERKAQSAGHPHNVLLVVHSISLRRGLRPVASGGTLEERIKWRVDKCELIPTAYTCVLSDHGKRKPA